jgi:hypothetical protein
MGGGFSNQGLLQTRDTLLAGNTVDGPGTNSGPDLSGTLGSLGHNLVGNTQDGSGFDATDLLNVDPLLGPLQDNGGPTFTMALLPGSPAIDAGDNTDAPDWDQRGPGYPRITAEDPVIDIGAFEVQQDGGNGPGREMLRHAKPVPLEVAALLDNGPSLSMSRIASEAKPLGRAVDAVFANDGATQLAVGGGRSAEMDDFMPLLRHKGLTAPDDLDVFRVL